MIIVCLIILVPLIACVHPVEVLGFAWPVFVVPPVYLSGRHNNMLHLGPASKLQAVFHEGCCPCVQASRRMFWSLACWRCMWSDPKAALGMTGEAFAQLATHITGRSCAVQDAPVGRP